MYRNANQRRRARCRRKGLRIESLESRRLLTVSGEITSDTTWSADTVISGDLLIRPGVTLTVASGVRVTVEEGADVLVEGTFDVASNATIRMDDGSANSLGSDNRIEIRSGGSVLANSSRFDRNGSGNDRTQLIVKSGGEFSFLNSNFDLDAVAFEDGSVIGPGGVTGNGFDTPIFTPLAHLFPGNPNLLANERFLDVEILNGQTINNGESLTLLPMGTVTTTNMRYRLNDLTVAAGGSLTFGPGTDTITEENLTLSIAGDTTIDNVASFTMIDGDDFGGTSNLIDVVDGGNLELINSVIDRSFTGDQRDVTQIIVRSGGEFESTDTTFDIDRIVFEDASLIGPNGVTGSRFDTPIFTPLAHLFPGNPNLLANERFLDVEILNGQTINNGESLTLLPMGTVTTTNMRYRLNDLTVAAGGSLTFGPGTDTITEENLTLSIAGDTTIDNVASFTMIDGDDFGGTSNLIDVVDGGNLELINSVIDRSFTGDQRDVTQIIVRSGGEFESTDTTFDIDRIVFEDASLIGPNGVTGSRFDTPIFTPLAHLFPGNPNLLANERFLDVEILNGQTINNGESLTLLPMGTVTTTNMRYRLNDLTVAAGGSLTFGPGTDTITEENLTLSIAGDTTIDNVASFTMIDGDDFGGTSNLIDVVDGGNLELINSVIDRSFTGDQRDVTQIIVRSGGEFESTDTTFDIDRIVFEDASLIGPNGVTGSRFDTPIFTPLAHLFPGNPNLLANERFLDVEILNGQTINNGESLTLLPMGTVTTTNMRYRLNDLTVAAGGSLTFGPGTDTITEENLTLSIAGDTTIDNVASFTMIDGDDFGGTSNLIDVVDGGNLELINSVIDRSFTGDQRDVTQIIVRSGGEFESTDTTFDIDRIVFEDASLIGPNGVTGSRFDTPIFTPLAHLFPGNPNLLANERFLDVEILNGQTINNGESGCYRWEPSRRPTCAIGSTI